MFLKNRKAFTLMELLTVFVIIGILLTILIPGFTKIFTSNRKQLYEYQERVTKVAVDLFLDEIRSGLDKNKNVFDIDYKTLVDKGYIKEEKNKCEGTVQITRIKENSNDFTYKYFLKCNDDKGTTIVDNKNNPTPGTPVNGQYITEFSIYTTSEYNHSLTNNLYNYEWTANNLYVYVYALDLKRKSLDDSGIKKIRYSTDNKITWKEVNVSLDGGAKFVLDSFINNKIYYYLVDNYNNNSDHYEFSVKLDKAKPIVPIIRYVEGSNNNVWENRYNIEVKSTDVGSGINRYQVDFNNDSNPDLDFNNENFIPNFDINSNTVRFRSIDNVGNVSDWTQYYTIVLDMSNPGITNVVYNSGGSTHAWQMHANISLSSTDNVSGIKHYEVDVNGDNNPDHVVGNNFIPWTGFSSNNVRFRSVDNANNKGEWTNPHSLLIDDQRPHHESWWWGEVNSDVARLYIRVNDSYSGINRVQCPTSTQAGAFNNWHWFNAVWDPGANAFRCDINPNLFGHYGQLYKTHLYVFDNANNGGYYNESLINIPTKNQYVRYDFNSMHEFNSNFDFWHYKKFNYYPDSILTADNSTIHFKNVSIDVHPQFKIKNKYSINWANIRLGMWGYSGFRYKELAAELDNGQFISILPQHGYNSENAHWHAHLESRKRCGVEINLQTVIIDKRNNVCIGVGPEYPEGWNTYSFAKEGEFLKIRIDGVEKYSAHIGNSRIVSIHIRPLTSWYNKDLEARLDWFDMNYERLN